MSRTNVGDWMKLNCGDPVCRKDDPRHTGRVIKIEHGSDVTIKWDGLLLVLGGAARGYRAHRRVEGGAHRFAPYPQR
jgi:hypothetical protein